MCYLRRAEDPTAIGIELVKDLSDKCSTNLTFSRDGDGWGILLKAAKVGQSDLELLLVAIHSTRDKNTTIHIFPRPMRRDNIFGLGHFNVWGENGGEIGSKRQ